VEGRCLLSDADTHAPSATVTFSGRQKAGRLSRCCLGREIALHPYVLAFSPSHLLALLIRIPRLCGYETGRRKTISLKD
jgi:hypothetical protein